MEDGEPKVPRTHRNGAADDRQQRLAVALRDNLRRRKAQARARADAPQAPAAVPDVAPSAEDEGSGG